MAALARVSPIAILENFDTASKKLLVHPRRTIASE